MIDHLRADVRYTIKWLLRSPVFTAVAIASLGLGIGFNTALFSIVDALLLRPLPVERADRLVDVYTRGVDGDTYATSSYPDFLDFQAQNQVFEGMLGYSPALGAIRTSDQSRMAIGEVVTGNYFQLLGVRAAIGRTILPEDDRAGAPRVMMIAHRVWMKTFGGDPGVIGRPMRMRGQVYTIVGVTPERFTGMVPMLQPEMWVPVAWVEEIEPAGIQDSVPSPTGNTRLERRGQRWMFIRGRLKDGETATTAGANLQVIMRQLAAAHKATNDGRTVSVVANVRLHPQADKALRPVAAALMLGVGLVLLVACANVTNMLLARASSRQREIGIRLAIGATRGRLIRQLLTESVVLALVGAAAGTALAALLVRLDSVDADADPHSGGTCLTDRRTGPALHDCGRDDCGIDRRACPCASCDSNEPDVGVEGGIAFVGDRPPTLDVERRARSGPDRGHARAARRRGTPDTQHSRST